MQGFWQGSAMPRKLRIEFEGAIYHVMNRGDCRKPIFRTACGQVVCGTGVAGLADFPFMG